MLWRNYVSTLRADLRALFRAIPAGRAGDGIVVDVVLPYPATANGHGEPAARAPQAPLLTGAQHDPQEQAQPIPEARLQELERRLARLEQAISQHYQAHHYGFNVMPVPLLGRPAQHDSELEE